MPTQYTVVICPECHYVWLVGDTPDTSMCGRCQTRHQFTDLKHYHQTETRADAVAVRAEVQAQLSDHDDAWTGLSESRVDENTDSH